MPRDASGTYTLPAGNPVVTATTIDSSWANDTMDDIKDEMTDSLSRSGNGGMLVAFENASGTVGAPGMTWTSEPTSGFYLAATNDMRASIAGSDRARFRADATNPFQVWSSGAWADMLSEGSTPTLTGAWTFSALVTANLGLTVTGANITAGTVDADFDAVTATSYGGITEANLVDKSAAETIAGSWTFTANIVAGTADADFDAVTATSYGGITEANLVDKSASETISGAWTFTGIPILDAPVTVADFGTGGRVKDGGDTARPIGFNVMPAYEIDAADTFDLAHNGMLWHKDAGGAVTYTLDNDADIPQGATFVIANRDTEDITIAEGVGVTLYWMDGGGVTPPDGNLTLAEAGVCTVYKYSDTVYLAWGNGLT
jgi:hypothetical protein